VGSNETAATTLTGQAIDDQASLGQAGRPNKIIITF